MTYNLKPDIKIKGNYQAWQGNEAVYHQLQETARKLKPDYILAFECYPGVNLDELRQNLSQYFPEAYLVCADDSAFDAETVTSMIQPTLTDDRVFGIMSHATLDQFFPEENLQIMQAKMKLVNQPVIVYGTGAILVAPVPDLLIYADLTRWEIQLRYRKGLSNWKANNSQEDQLRKFKRGYFFEWRMADRLKSKVFAEIDFLLDTNIADEPRLVTGHDYRAALKQAVSQPFRLVPYFDASVWGGQWMKRKFHLDPSVKNYGWAFDGVPEENSLILDFDGVKVEVPALNLVREFPDELLGKKVRSRFGREFPIRFDYLDTVSGGNLSMQVHPMIDYIQDKFGMTYTQNESYYILDATDESSVYLGLKEGVKKADLVADLRKAEQGGNRFPDEKYINRFPAKKHDHFLIPSGTIHCSGAGTVVLEISQTPYIFTFKLWDWDRLGLDGIPRPVHIEHGQANIQMDYDTKWVKENLINQFETIEEDSEHKEEKTGLHELESIETRRHWFKNKITLETKDSVNMLNLVEGESVTVKSLDGGFDAYEVHFGETFIVPEQVKKYLVVNHTGREVALIQAYVRV